jgi:chemotaxis protein CheC
MANLHERLDGDVISSLEKFATEGIRNAAVGFSSMVGQTLTVLQPEVKMISLKELDHLLGDPEKEAVGIYLKAEGDLGAQMMLVIPFEKALELVDLLMEVPQGTTTSLGRLERSALCEVGNITGTFFLNSIATMSGLSIRPTPPALIVDMLGAIIDIVAAATGNAIDETLLLQGTFTSGERKVDVGFWVIPDGNTIRILQEKRSLA